MFLFQQVKNIEIIFEMGILLETHELSKACIVYTKEDLAELKNYTDIDINQEGEETIIETNDLFHQKIMKTTNNQSIIDIYQKLKSYIYLVKQSLIREDLACLKNIKPL